MYALYLIPGNVWALAWVRVGGGGLIQLLRLALQASRTVSGCSCTLSILLGHVCSVCGARTSPHVLGSSLSRGFMATSWPGGV